MMTIKSLERIINLFYYSGFIYYLFKKVINFLKVENDSHQSCPLQFKDLNYFQPFYYTPRKLRSWVEIEKLNWDLLSKNPSAIHLLANNLDYLNWNYVSMNPQAISWLELEPDIINWFYLSKEK